MDTQGLPPPPPPPLPGTLGAIPMPTYKEMKQQEQAAIEQSQYANLPEKLMNTLAKDKKPFTYTPLAVGDKGKLDLSQIRSPRMKKRLMANLQDEDPYSEENRSLTPEIPSRNQELEDKLSVTPHELRTKCPPIDIKPVQPKVFKVPPAPQIDFTKELLARTNKQTKNPMSPQEFEESVNQQLENLNSVIQKPKQSYMNTQSYQDTSKVTPYNMPPIYQNQNHQMSEPNQFYNQSPQKNYQMPNYQMNQTKYQAPSPTFKSQPKFQSSQSPPGYQSPQKYNLQSVDHQSPYLKYQNSAPNFQASQQKYPSYQPSINISSPEDFYSQEFQSPPIYINPQTNHQNSMHYKLPAPNKIDIVQDFNNNQANIKTVKYGPNLEEQWRMKKQSQMNQSPAQSNYPQQTNQQYRQPGNQQNPINPNFQQSANQYNYQTRQPIYQKNYQQSLNQQNNHPQAYYQPVNHSSGNQSAQPFMKQSGDEDKYEPIQSKSFRVLQKLTEGIEDEIENLKLAQQEQLDEINSKNMGSPQPEWLHKDPRYLGPSIPSNSFKYLKDMVGISDEEATQSNPQVPNFRRLQSQEPIKDKRKVRTEIEIPIMLEERKVPASQQGPQPSPPKYVGSSIPSRSFRMLQMMTNEETYDPHSVTPYGTDF